MAEITLVTAFFDIGRGNMNGSYLQRNNEQYFQYFEHWARMKNRLIVYTQAEYTDRIMAIREKFGLGKITKIIEIDDIYSVEPNLINKMIAIEKNEDFKNLRYIKEDISNTARYNYIMLMKYWFLKDAFERGLIKEIVAWFDFGFDHGGEVYPYSEDFDFEWKYNFSDKINLFCLQDPTEVSGIDSLQLFINCVMGAPVVLPAVCSRDLWRLTKKAMEMLISIDCIDDDQQLLLMAYKMEPDLFDIKISDWFLPLKLYGGDKLRINKYKVHGILIWLRRCKFRLIIKSSFLYRCFCRIKNMEKLGYGRISKDV